MELTGDNITINVPKGLLDKYNVSINDFTDVKAYITKNYTFDFDVDLARNKYCNIVNEKLEGFKSPVQANQREFGLKFFKLARWILQAQSPHNIESYGIRTYESRRSEFYLDDVFVKDMGDKVKLSTSNYINLDYSVVLDK